MAKSSVKRGAIVLFNNSDTFTRRLVRRGSTLRPNGRCDRLVLAKCAGYGAVRASQSCTTLAELALPRLSATTGHWRGRLEQGVNESAKARWLATYVIF